MPTISTTYVPFDPLNICSICGTLERKSRLRRLPGGLYGCSRGSCVNERTALELDRANARQKPFRILPVPDARPQTWNLPDDYQADEGEILNFCSRMVPSQARFESVTSGDLAPLASSSLSSFGWMGRYLYGMISENKRPRVMLSKAASLLTSIATSIQAKQVNNAATAVNGAVIESGATQYLSQDAASCGLALLYAYRVTGTRSYLDSARAAASYLRNVQAIGSCGANFTSSDAGGTARLYTGGIAHAVSTTFGIDPGQFFYSDHLFYAYDLLTLEFWKAFLATDGDQLIGSTTALNGFTAAPSQLLSTSISDLRAFWENGVRDSAGQTFTGLSSVTPREFFNAYPALKTGYTIVGTGRWEFQDGIAATGTMVTAQNFAIALESLFAYEGASTQVTSVNDWLRSFSANPTFAATGHESISQLARSTVGPFEPTASPTTLLQVRDPASGYAAIARNGSSLYDWGAFGVLSALWGSQNTSSFTQSRMLPLGRNQRFYDGQRSDGDHLDWITLRGLSGLGYQTAFLSDTIDPGATTAYAVSAQGNATVTSPSRIGLIQWFKGDVGVTVVNTNHVSAWADQSGLNQHFLQSTDGERPYLLGNTINGVPALSFGVAGDANKHMSTAGNLLDRNGVPLTGSSPRTVMVVSRPRFDNAFARTGGTVWSMGTWFAMFELRSDLVTNGAYAWMRAAGDYANALQFTPIAGGAGGPYDGVALVTEHSSPGFPSLAYRVNNSTKALTPASMYGTPATGGSPAQLSEFSIGFLGSICEVLVFDYDVTTNPDAQAQNVQYLAGRYSSAPVSAVSLAMTNDIVRAAQFGQAFRVNPTFPMSV